MDDVIVKIVDHGADQRIEVEAGGGVLTVDTVGAADASRTAGTYTIGASDYTAAAAGTGAEFSIVVDGSGDATVTITTIGSGFVVDETITISDANLGGGGAADLTFDVATITPALPSAGDRVRWTDSNGIVQYGNVYSVDSSANTVDITLAKSTERLSGTEDLYTADGNTLLADGKELKSDDVYNTLEYATDKKWSSIAPQPGTSSDVDKRGGQYDEFHIILIDGSDGNASGTPGEVIEVHTYVSKAKDARSDAGASLYWKTVINENSDYIYAGGEPLLDDSTELLTFAGLPTGKTAGSLSDAANNKVFKMFSVSGEPIGSETLKNGGDYNFSGAQSTIDTAVASGYELVEDPEVFGDIDFLVPGKINATIANKLIAIAEKRRDCMVTVSPQRTDVVNSNTTTKKTEDIIKFFKTLPSSSFAIYDSGYKYIYDKYNDVYRYVPCAADVSGLFINTTNTSETWFSPAGYNRGQILNATKLAFSPRQDERDRLYTNRVNPITAFPGQGTVLFGDKTALASPSAFDRINVRRLFIELEKNIANFSKYQLFELNDELTRSGFRSAVEPYLRGVQGRRGIYDFLVVCDTSNNTPDVIDRNEFVAEIFIKPARSINFITLNFIAVRTGVSFSEIGG